MQKLRYLQVQDIHILKRNAATKVIQLKPKLKKRIHWKTEKIYQKRDILHKSA